MEIATYKIYDDADKDSACIVTDAAWDRSAASCLSSLLRGASPEVVAWFNKMGFSWTE